MYVRGYLQGSENGRVVTIAVKSARSQIGTGQIGPKSNWPQVKSATDQIIVLICFFFTLIIFQFFTINH